MATSYDRDDLEQIEVQDLGQLAAWRGRRQVLWVHVEGLGDAEIIRQIGRLFHLHDLALEDVVNSHQQVKIEDYGDHLFLVGRLVDETEHGRTEQLSAFLGDDFLVTFQEHSSEWLVPVRARLLDSHSQLRQRGPDFLAYALLDTVIDGYFPLLEDYGERLDVLEEMITADPTRVARDLHEIRTVLRSLRRAVWSHRDAISRLLHDPNPLIHDDTRTFLRDCYDHTLQLVDLLEVYRETCTDLRDVHLSSVSIRLNEIMKVLTIIATIFMPLGFIAGVYGMNFNTRASPWNMPELNWFFGYPFAIGLMAVVTCGLLLFFHAKGWLGQRDD